MAKRSATMDTLSALSAMCSSMKRSTDAEKAVRLRASTGESSPQMRVQLSLSWPKSSSGSISP